MQQSFHSLTTSFHWLLSLRQSCCCCCTSVDHFWEREKKKYFYDVFLHEQSRCGVGQAYLLILALFLQPSPPSQWLLRVPRVIMLPQLVHGFPFPYGCNTASDFRLHDSIHMYNLLCASVLLSRVSLNKD